METHDDVNYNNEGKATVTSNEDASLCAFSNTFRMSAGAGGPLTCPPGMSRGGFSSFCIQIQTLIIDVMKVDFV